MDALAKTVAEQQKTAATIPAGEGGALDWGALAEALRPIIREEIDRTRLGKAEA